MWQTLAKHGKTHFLFETFYPKLIYQKSKIIECKMVFLILIYIEMILVLFLRHGCDGFFSGFSILRLFSRSIAQELFLI